MKSLCVLVAVLLVLLTSVNARGGGGMIGRGRGGGDKQKGRRGKNPPGQKKGRGGRKPNPVRNKPSSLDSSKPKSETEIVEGDLPDEGSEGRSKDDEEEGVTCIRQKDFTTGTLIIDNPGIYKLCENIVFDPNAPQGDVPSEDAYDPIFPGEYSKNAYGLGFFSAIAIQAPDVEIRLNSHSIEQSKGHALFQRYFAVFELASSPFIKGAGPAQFIGEEEVCICASNLKILGPGVIGLSSHHGIHGNDNKNVEIRNVVFVDFEVAAVSLNNIDGLVIQDCEILHNRHDVPINGMFSAARFIRPYAKELKERGYKMNLRGEEVTAAKAYDDLIEAINNVYFDVVAHPDINNGMINPEEHRMEYDLFRNHFHVIDGPCYAFVVHGRGPAVGDQGFVFNENNTTTSSNILIKDNKINNIKCWTKEIPSVVENSTVINDVRGAVFQVVDVVDMTLISSFEDGTYKGNVVADLQIMVAKAILEGVLEDDPLRQTTPNTISPIIIEWAESEDMVFNPSYRCNGDAMHHVNKGIIVIRVEDTQGFQIEGNSISEIKNLSPKPFTNCFDYHAVASPENEGEQQGGNIRGISVTAVRGFVDERGMLDHHSTIKDNIITNLSSNNPNVIVGIDVQGDSKAVLVEDNVVDLSSRVGTSVMDEFIALRVRKHVDNEGDDMVIIGDNSLMQDLQILNNRRLRNKPDLGQKDMELEWKVGGCPFGYGRGQRPN
jgi:hypothetical protein